MALVGRMAPESAPFGPAGGSRSSPCLLGALVAQTAHDLEIYRVLRAADAAFSSIRAVVTSGR